MISQLQIQFWWNIDDIKYIFGVLCMAAKKKTTTTTTKYEQILLPHVVLCCHKSKNECYVHWITVESDSTNLSLSLCLFLSCWQTRRDIGHISIFGHSYPPKKNTCQQCITCKSSSMLFDQSMFFFMFYLFVCLLLCKNLQILSSKHKSTHIYIYSFVFGD